MRHLAFPALRALRACALATLGALALAARAGAEPAPADTLIEHLDDPDLRAVAAEVLDRHPDLAAAEARLEALRRRAPQVSALPDPMASLTAFLLPPETRVGPQRLSLGIQQRIPWLARLDLRERDAVLAAAIAEARLEALRLELVTRTRVLWLELAFLERERAILVEERGHLERHEEAARARYASGTGLAQGPIKIQAELTRIDTRLLDLDSRRRMLLAELAGLRDRFDGDEPDAVLPAVEVPALDVEALAERALARRPEVAAARLGRERAKVGVELAETSRRPDVTLGLAWTLVGGREDPAGRADPPPDDGDDVLAVTGGVHLPIRRRALEAELEEALALENAAGADQRRVESGIRRRLADLTSRLPLEQRQLTLLRDVLERQAEEAVHSAVSAYTTGAVGALDLLDAEHRLFEVRVAAARARADVAIALAELEGTIGGPLADPELSQEPRHE